MPFQPSGFDLYTRPLVYHRAELVRTVQLERPTKLQVLEALRPFVDALHDAFIESEPGFEATLNLDDPDAPAWEIRIEDSKPVLAVCNDAAPVSLGVDVIRWTITVSGEAGATPPLKGLLNAPDDASLNSDPGFRSSLVPVYSALAAHLSLVPITKRLSPPE